MQDYRPLDIRTILAQIIVATVIEREHAVLERERGGLEPASAAACEEARLRKLAFVSMLTAEERADARASFRALLSDLPGVMELPYAVPAQAPACYPLRSFTLSVVRDGALAA
jgi:hypothetical protein